MRVLVSALQFVILLPAAEIHAAGAANHAGRGARARRGLSLAAAAPEIAAGRGGAEVVPSAINARVGAAQVERSFVAPKTSKYKICSVGSFGRAL